MTLPSVPDPSIEPIPRHIAIVMDGNGRWARARGQARIRGHERGAESVRAVLNACREVGVEYLTLYAFSVENWVRPKNEIEGLKRLLLRFLKQNEDELHENRVRLRVIGRLIDFGGRVQAEMERVMASTREYADSQLVLALSYGGRTEIAHAARRIAEDVRSGLLAPEDVDEAAVAARLYAPDIPDPDLMIRTSGEMRISNFLLWQISYAELYITDVMWPDFRAPHLYEAIRAFGRRRRRFGGVAC
jgi:undecaprenyl diphosphate synthase